MACQLARALLLCACAALLLLSNLCSDSPLVSDLLTSPEPATPSSHSLRTPHARVLERESTRQKQRTASAASRYAYGISAPLDVPSPPPPEPPAHPSGRRDAGECRVEHRFDPYLHMRSWTATEAAIAKGFVRPPSEPIAPRGYSCYRHRDVRQDPSLGRSTCRISHDGKYGPRRCPVLEPTFPTPPSQCLCCPMAGHRCPTCWGCLLPLSRRRAFEGKLYERETGGTADVFLASEAMGSERLDLVFKLRKGEVEDAERLNSKLVDSVAGRCGLLRPAVAREWVAELAVIPPLPSNWSAPPWSEEATHFALAAERVAANRRPAIATQACLIASMQHLAHGVSIDMLLRTHAQGPNKQEAHGAKARAMIHRMRMLDSRSIVRAALFDFLFAAADRHLEHVGAAACNSTLLSFAKVLMHDWGGIELIDNAHTTLKPRVDVRFGPNSLFLPGSNFFMRNLHGFPFLHCCVGSNVCPSPKPPDCPGRHTLYWPALILDYRCHVPGGRLGLDFPLQTRRCLTELSSQSERNLSQVLGITAHGRGGRRTLRRLVRRARALLSLGMEDAWLSLDHSHGYYQEGKLHNGEGVPTPCCSLTLDGETSNGQNDEWRCHSMLPRSIPDGSLLAQQAGSGGETLLPRHASVAPRANPGVLYTLSTAERRVPTNQSHTPSWLTHRLGREGDWIFPGRVHWPVVGASARALSSEGLEIRAVDVGSGLWAAVTDDLHLCARVAVRNPSEARCTVGESSLFLLAEDGKLFCAAADRSIRGDGSAGEASQHSAERQESAGQGVGLGGSFGE
ncbi:MAG: hypothetical protein SGPRY_011660, partial [Prymnesium sp.]